MKRKFSSAFKEEHVERKRRQTTSITPFSSKWSLAHLCMLNRFVFKTSFCICLDKEIVMPQQSCDYCSRTDGKSSGNHEGIKHLMQRYANLTQDGSEYKVHAMLQELQGHCGAKSVEMEEINTDEGDGRVRFVVSDLKHVSWFLVQILIMSGPFSNMTLDLVSKEMILECKSHKTQEASEKKSELSDMVSLMKKNILSVCWQSELKSCIQSKKSKRE